MPEMFRHGLDKPEIRILDGEFLSLLTLSFVLDQHQRGGSGTPESFERSDRDAVDNVGRFGGMIFKRDDRVSSLEHFKNLATERLRKVAELESCISVSATQKKTIGGLVRME